MPKAHSKSHRITLDDVARKAGVSKWAASRSFTPGASVAAHKREKVLVAARELGYQPSMLARALSKKQSRLVVIVQDDFANPHGLLLLEKMTRALQAEGFQSLLVNIGSRNYNPVLETAQQYQAGVVILLGTQFDEQLLSQLDDDILLLAMARSSHHERICYVSCEDRAIGQAVAQHVYEKGYHRPLFLSGPGTENTHLSRYSEFNQHFTKLGGNKADILPCLHYEQQVAFEKMMEYLDNTPKEQRADILICENDIIAVGAIDALKYRHDIAIPQEIAVVGVDNIALSASPAYDITTYAQPLDAMIASGVQIVSEWVEKKLQPTPMMMEGELIVRSSS